MMGRLRAEPLGGDPVAAASAAAAVAAAGGAALGSRRPAPGDSREQQRRRVDRRVVAAHLEVEVRPGRVAGRADVTDPRAAVDHLAGGDDDRGEVRVPAGVAEPVLDDDEVAVAAGVVAGEYHRADAPRTDRRPCRDGEVDAAVEVVAAVDTEAVAHRTGDRAQEAHRARGWRGGALAATATQRPQGFGPGDPVDADPRRRLRAPDRRFGQRPEDPVGPAGAAAGPLQQVLQRRHVPAPVAVAHRATAQARTAAPAERPPRPRPEDAVHDKAAAPLQGNDRPPRLRPFDPVNVAVIKPQSLQRRLQSGDSRR